MHRHIRVHFNISLISEILWDCVRRRIVIYTWVIDQSETGQKL